MNKILLVLIMFASFMMQAQDVTFCYNPDTGHLTVEDVPYIVNGRLLDPNDTGNNYPYIRRVTISSLTTTVTGTIVVSVDAVDDDEELRYAFFTDRIENRRRVDGQTTGWINRNTTTFRYRNPGTYNIYVSVVDPNGQSSRSNAPDVTITEN